MREIQDSQPSSIIDEHGTTQPRFATCTTCLERVPCTQQQTYPDNGWVLPIDVFGYYGGFDDDLSVLSGNRQSRLVIMCHDCVVKFLNLFPRVAEIVGANCHSCHDEIPCCAHAWQATEIFGKKVYGVHSRTSWPDGVWHDDPAENPYNTHLPIKEEEI